MATFDKFNWTDDLSVGVDLMDSQHRILINYINDLIETLENDELDPIKEKFEALCKYVVEHFTEEETFMEKIGFPGLESHKGIHASLIKRMGEFELQIKTK